MKFYQQIAANTLNSKGVSKDLYHKVLDYDLFGKVT